MQERYLGDSHDFLKYALLRRLRESAGLRLGVNWYLTHPDEVDRPGNSDGEKRHHLNGGDWQSTDPDLFSKIGAFADLSSRRLANVATWGVLPNDTIYFDERVPVSGRSEWHQRGLSTLESADLIFFDPDNGFEVKSMSVRTQPKYALYGELAEYLAREQTVLAIQFARQCDPVRRALETRDKLANLYGARAALPVIRGRVAPNILFFTVAPLERHTEVSAALNAFARNCSKAEAID